MADLACGDQFPHRAGHLLNRHVGINAMLIEEVDDVDLKPLQGTFDGPLNVFRLTIDGRSSGLVVRTGQVEAELCGDDHLVANGLERFTHDFLVGERTVDFRRVKEGDAAIHGLADERDGLIFAQGMAVAEVQAHAAEADGRDFQVAFTELAFLHGGGCPFIWVTADRGPLSA
jgi:hypothetical protein